jgi:hypothetical protein
VLFGDFGYLTEPRIDRFTVVMLENKTVYTDGDTVQLHTLALALTLTLALPHPKPKRQASHAP